MSVQGPAVVKTVPVVFKVLQQTLRTDGGVGGVVPLGQPLQGGKKIWSSHIRPDRSRSSRRCHQLWAVASGQSASAVACRCCAA